MSGSVRVAQSPAPRARVRRAGHVWRELGAAGRALRNALEAAFASDDYLARVEAAEAELLWSRTETDRLEAAVEAAYRAEIERLQRELDVANATATPTGSAELHAGRPN